MENITTTNAATLTADHSARPEAAPEPTKTCTTCCQQLPLASFAKKRSGLSPKCRSCTNAYSRAHYLANRNTRIQEVKVRKTKVRNELRSLVAKTRDGSSCCVCHATADETTLVSLSETGQVADLVRREVRAPLLAHLETVRIDWYCRPCLGAHVADNAERMRRH